MHQVTLDEVIAMAGVYTGTVYNAISCFTRITSNLVPRCLFRWFHKPIETAETTHKIFVDDLIFANLQFSSIEKFNYM
jgi:phosphatidylglycerophosphatase A